MMSNLQWTVAVRKEKQCTGCPHLTHCKSILCGLAHCASETQFSHLVISSYLFTGYTVPPWQHDVNVCTQQKVILQEKVAPGSAIVMKDTYLKRFGDLQTLNEGLAHHYTVSTISDVWLQLDAEERDRQSIKTKMSKAPNADHEPIAYEYFFRRCYGDKCFNHLLWIMRQLQTKPEAETSQPKA
ncbi:unnamed protein product [Caenorhabditis bovis]|uniref:Uncharacterized protein n=1 Tax=Caenorhabditis bovis TaxID=2654633 RepID=A0A8S1FEF9_9PELO|nr:unnamed protein product [Caenorhabditis bovis]